MQPILTVNFSQTTAAPKGVSGYHARRAVTLTSNPLKAALARGDVQIGTWLNLARNPAILTLLQSAGLNYARLDMEHSSPSIETVADMAVLARALDFPLVVRPPAGNREWITRLLDIGVWGLHVPQVDTPEIARQVAEAARYAPLGMRGMAGLSSGTDFDVDNAVAARQIHLNEQVHVTVMLESAEAFRHLDEIVSTPGIDAVTLGPTDLAQDLGVFGTPHQNAVLDEHRQRLIAAAQAHGKQAAMLVDTVAEAQRWIEAGVLLIAYASDVAVLHRGYADAVRAIRR
ncbi:MAG TPA: aldolase/citrate lyase family protein [Chloroflexota bacterium]|nr:aldolase/citrate lyase family protein [Chloroflexota bacterium]